MERLSAGSELKENQQIVSSNRQYSLWMQADGNLVLYQSGTGKPIWHTNTATGSGNTAAMQLDGNFVVYQKGGKPIWHTDTGVSGQKNADRYLIVTDGGKIWIVTGTKNVTDVPAKG